MKAILPLIVALCLPACTVNRAEPVVRTVYVDKPVQQPCKAKVAPRPRYADQDAGNAPDIFEQVRALLLGIEQRKAREAKLEDAVTSCGGSVN